MTSKARSTYQQTQGSPDVGLVRWDTSVSEPQLPLNTNASGHAHRISISISPDGSLHPHMGNNKAHYLGFGIAERLSANEVMSGLRSRSGAWQAPSTYLKQVALFPYMYLSSGLGTLGVGMVFRRRKRADKESNPVLPTHSLALHT